MHRLVRSGIPVIAAWAAALVCGCDFLAFTDVGLVKQRMRDHAAAISAKEWKKAAAYHDRKMQWRSGRNAVRGPAATQAFLTSIRNIQSNDTFFTEVESIKEVKPGQIVAEVTFQAHIIESSMTMSYSNIVWTARMLWVKRGNADWRIIAIQETSPRKKGKYSRAGG